MSKMLKMGRNRYCIRTAWAPKAWRPTLKSTHVRPSSPSVWSNHILCSFYFEFSYLSNVQILLNGHVDQVFHKFCGAIPPSLMVFYYYALPMSYHYAQPMDSICWECTRVWKRTIAEVWIHIAMALVPPSSTIILKHIDISVYSSKYQVWFFLRLSFWGINASFAA